MADPLIIPVLTVDSVAYAARYLIGSSNVPVSAPLVYGVNAIVPGGNWDGKIVLIDRGVNTFAEKIANAKQGRALGVIVANNVPGTVVVFQIGTGAPADFPAVSVSQADGLTLRGKVQAVATMGPPAPPPPPPPNFTLPDPTGKAGFFACSDGRAYILAKPLPSVPGISIEFGAQVGQQFALGVSSEGAGPFTYQWVKDGAFIAGATSPLLNIASAQPSDAGIYLCQVTSPAGTAPSGAGVVTVKP